MKYNSITIPGNKGFFDSICLYYKIISYITFFKRTEDYKNILHTPLIKIYIYMLTIPSISNHK